MRVGIDASNLRAGGGITHLVELLRACEPAAARISRVVVWGGADTLARVPAAPWLSLQHEPELDRSLPYRLAWQRFTLQRRAAATCDLLFSPGGSYGGSFRPFATMSRNLLPFQPAERQRYGASWMRVKLALLRYGQAATYRRADGVIFLNDYARECVLEDVGHVPGLTAVIPHGVDDGFRAAPRPPRPIESCSSARPFRLLYVSNVEFYKHQWHVVDAVARLRAEGLPVVLELIGSAYPPAGARLARAIATFDPTGSFVTYRGGLSHAELAVRYAEAEAFVFASSCENMPNILLEAMASGLPIACANMGPMPAMLGDAGVYFDPTAPAGIATAVGGLVRDAAARADLAARAADRARAYSWRRCADETLNFLAAVASRHAAARH